MRLAAAFLLAAGLHGSAAGSVTLGAIAVPAGGTVSVTASGLPPSSPMAVTLDGQEEATATTDATGALAAQVEVPAATTTGTHLVAVEADDGSAVQARLAVEPPDAPTVSDVAVPTAGAGTLHVAVSVPSGAGSGVRYPVIYFLHGLPAGATSYQGWPVALNDRLGLDAQRAIFVAPQAATTADPDPEYLDLGAQRNWASAIAVELPRYVDAHFPTIRSRAARAVIGVSAGGYGAFSLGLAHLATFSVIESWSGYFEPTTPNGRTVRDLGSKRSNARASIFAKIPTLAARLAAEPTFLGFYVGRGDALFAPENIAFHRKLHAAKVPHTWGIYPAGHVASLWLTEAPLWIELALDHLDTAG